MNGCLSRLVCVWHWNCVSTHLSREGWGCRNTLKWQTDSLYWLSINQFLSIIFSTGRNKTCFFVLRNQEKTRHRFRARSKCLFISSRFPWIVIRINVFNYCNYFVMRSKSSSDNQRDGLSLFFFLQVTSLITGFVCKLHTSLSNSLYLKQLAQIGFLAHFESLLTTNGRLGFSLQMLFK